ncbi:hypothetical protein BD410DRAFT_843652 [Rickenella mellea]|uniref:Uncharacterized protein n=1 Tax=Rickenella mellea TaxID=50990 RepID=A0A4Y7PPM1_9AGAM|nr:hypothetical protein BD410DRAFT_843652 [Rickenella mellea]
MLPPTPFMVLRHLCASDIQLLLVGEARLEVTHGVDGVDGDDLVRVEWPDAFVLSALGNLYSRKMGGTAFTMKLKGISLLIPTGLAEAGGLSDSYTGPGEEEYTDGLELLRKMISVIIGVMPGVYLSARIIYSFGKKETNAMVTF